MKTALIVGVLFVVLVIVGAVYFMEPQRFSDTTEPIGAARLAVGVAPLATPVLVAEARGFFDERGLSVTSERAFSGNQALTMLLEGKADFATTADLPIMFQGFERSDFRVLATFVSSQNSAKVITRDPEIRNAVDLVGKRIGVTEGTSGQYFLHSFLLTQGINPETVIEVNTAPNMMVEALENGTVDAVAAWEPFAYIAVQNGGRIIAPDINPHRITFNLVASQEYLAENPEAVRAMLQALEDAEKYIQVEREDAQRILVSVLEEVLGQTTGSSAEFVEAVWDDFTFDLVLDNELLFTLKQEAQWALSNGLVSGTIPDYRFLIFDDALRSVDPAAVRYSDTGN